MPKKRVLTIYICLCLALAASVLLSLCVGSVSLSPAALWQKGSVEHIILQSVRLPRTLAALIAGVGLSLSGVLLQSVMGNPLAGPNTIGVNAGAGLSVVLCLWLLPTASALLPLAAFLGAFLTLMLILLLSKKAGGGKATVVLAGIACTTLFQSLISFGVTLDSDILSMYNGFSVGSLAGVITKQLLLPGVLVALCLGVALCLCQKITALSMGDFVAASLGIRVGALRTVSLLLASMSAAAVISFAGLLGFVGLVVPHITRKLLGASISRQLTAAPLVGGTLVLLSDLAGRTLFAPSEISVGIVMALIGAPFFFILIVRGKRYA